MTSLISSHPNSRESTPSRVKHSSAIARPTQWSSMTCSPTNLLIRRRLIRSLLAHVTSSSRIRNSYRRTRTFLATADWLDMLSSKASLTISFSLRKQALIKDANLARMQSRTSGPAIICGNSREWVLWLIRHTFLTHFLQDTMKELKCRLSKLHKDDA